MEEKCCRQCHSCQGSHTCHGCCGRAPQEITLTRPQARFLARFAQTPFLPVCRLTFPASGPDSALLFLEAGKASDAVQAAGQLLSQLNALGLITLDYDQPLSNYDYSEYEAPALLRQALPAGADPSAAPHLERGSMALTPLGSALLEQVLELL